MGLLTAARRIVGGGTLAALLLAQGTTLAGQSAPTPEYQLKAVFLFNFAQFVEWPPSAFADPAAPLVIGILGEDPFSGYLDETVRGEKVKDRPLTVRRYRSVDEITTCHILYVSRREQDHLAGILGRLRGRSILTVSDADEFARSGGMIRFLTEHGRIRLRVNLKAAQAAGLTLSSKLLRPAQIVASGED
jgi:hypothetical protein